MLHLPIISVVIASYNRKVSLLQTLAALEAQTLSSNLFEVIVVNDGSTDGTEEVLRIYKNNTSMQFLFLQQSNGGPAAARNKGVAHALGQWIAFTDDDCLPDANWLQTIFSVFSKTNWVGVQGSTFTDRDHITPLTHQIDNENGNRSVPTCNAAYYRKALIAIGGFDEEFPFPHNEDADLAWRIQQLGTIGFSSGMRVHHPPRVDQFKKVAKRMKILESEFRLFYKDKYSYQLNRANSAWKNIYWEIGCKTQWYYLKSRLKFWKQPILLMQGVSLTLIWWYDLVRLYPRFRKSAKNNKMIFAK